MRTNCMIISNITTIISHAKICNYLMQLYWNSFWKSGRNIKENMSSDYSDWNNNVKHKWQIGHGSGMLKYDYKTKCNYFSE